MKLSLRNYHCAKRIAIQPKTQNVRLFNLQVLVLAGLN